MSAPARRRSALPPRAAEPPAVLKPLGYLPALDGVRALAVLGVMSWHYVLPGVKGGFLGVDLFFVLSGFLITRLLLEEWSATGGIHLGRFWMRRILRLFPALFLLLLAMQPFITREWTVYSLLYATNWGLLAGKLNSGPIMQLWSLSVEEQFYLVWPPLLLGLLALRAPRGAIAAVVVALAAAAAAFKMLTWQSLDSWSRFYFGSDARADELLIGCATAMLLSWTRLPRREWFGVLLQLATFPALVWIGWLMATSAVYRRDLYQQGYLTWFALAAAVVILQFVVAPIGWLRAAFAWRPVAWIGRISYGVYLWHAPVGWLTDARHYEWVPIMSRPVQFAVRVALTFVIAGLSYQFVERPLLRLKDRFAGRREPAAD